MRQNLKGEKRVVEVKKKAGDLFFFTSLFQSSQSSCLRGATLSLVSPLLSSPSSSACKRVRDWLFMQAHFLFSPPMLDFTFTSSLG